MIWKYIKIRYRLWKLNRELDAMLKGLKRGK
jgi:hypothetical protein